MSLARRTAAAKVIDDLKACSSSRDLQRGRSIHQSAILSGYDSDVYIASTLMYMYGKCGRADEARDVFDRLKHPNEVCWNALVFAYVDNGESETALALFSRMGRQGWAPNVRTFVAALRACADLAIEEPEDRRSSGAKGRKLHLLASRSGCVDAFVQGTLVDMYSKSGDMTCARRVFDSMIHPDVVCWTAIILGYADNGEGHTALDLFYRMRCEGCEMNPITFVAALKACTACALTDDKLKSKARGRKLHLQVLRSGCGDVHVQVTLVDMFAKCGIMEDAHKVFDHVNHPEVMCWTALISGYADNGEGEIALKLFLRMHCEGCAPDPRTFIVAFKACIDLAQEEEGIVKVASRNRVKRLHLLALRSGCSNYYVQGILVDAYGKCGCMEDAREVFDGTRHPDVVSWTALISGYAGNGKADVALHWFSRMGAEGCARNSFTYAVALKACGTLGALELGKAFHEEINSMNFKDKAVLGNALLDFYVKCGSLAEAEQVFSSHSTRNLITWNSLMAGYGRHGDIQGVFALFERMRSEGLQPDDITFKVILVACSHAGLVDPGVARFEEMSKLFGISPDIEHYNCVIDILCRANKLDNALALLRSVPFSLSVVTWMTVLGTCYKRSNVELGRLAFEALTSLDGEHGGAYVLMTNMYGRRGMWTQQARLQAMARQLNLTKLGESWWTSESGLVHKFIP